MSFGQGSDYAAQTKIMVLDETVSALRTEVGNLSSEVLHWKHEVEKLGVNPDYLTTLEDKVKRLEVKQNEAEVNIRFKIEEIAALDDMAEKKRQFAEVFGSDAEEAFFSLNSAWERKQRPKTIIVSVIGFLFGIVASILANYAGLVLPGL